MTNWPDHALAALTRLDPGPPLATLDEQLIRRLLNIRAALQTGRTDRFRWVLPTTIHNQLRDHARQQARERAHMSGTKWDDDMPDGTTTTLLGMNIRGDDNATTIMLELP